MAEEFVIRVQVDNLQGRSAVPKSGPGAEQDRGSQDNLSTFGELGQSIHRMGPLAKKLQRETIFGARDPNEMKQMMETAKVQNVSQQVLKRHIFTNDVVVSGTIETDMGDIAVTQHENVLNRFGMAVDSTLSLMDRHKARVRATATIAVNTAISSYISIHSHRAGNSYSEAQMRNGQYIASNVSSIGIAGAIWGSTAAIAFGVNFAITTGARVLVENANYIFDRRMDTNYIHNMSQVAGDLSYGRVFG